MEYKITRGKHHKKVSIKTEGGTKVIVHDRYGTYSVYRPKGKETIAMVGCGDLNITEGPRNYKVIQIEDMPELPYFEVDFKKDLTRAEAKAILRHKAKLIAEWEEEHQMACEIAFVARRRLMYGEVDYCINNPDEGWVSVEL